MTDDSQPKLDLSIAGHENTHLSITSPERRSASTSSREVLRLNPDGTSHYASEEDLIEAAAVFWRCASITEYGSAEIPALTAEPGKRAGFCIHRNGTIECFGGYQPDEQTQRILERIARLRP